MAFELYSMLAGNVSPMTGETVKPAYGGEEEAFLRKIITPIYQVIAKVLGYTLLFNLYLTCLLFWYIIVYYVTCSLAGSWTKQKRKIQAFTVEKLWRFEWIFLVFFILVLQRSLHVFHNTCSITLCVCLWLQVSWLLSFRLADAGWCWLLLFAFRTASPRSKRGKILLFSPLSQSIFCFHFFFFVVVHFTEMKICLLICVFQYFSPFIWVSSCVVYFPVSSYALAI